jgi:hypothetical protein
MGGHPLKRLREDRAQTGRDGWAAVVHDPYVKHWWEFEKQDSYPSPVYSLKRFFRNHPEGLVDLRVQRDLAEALNGVDAVVLAAQHSAYLELNPDQTAWLK